MIRFLYILTFIYSFEINSKEICDFNTEKCVKVSNSAAWILSIIETAEKTCHPNEVVNDWLKSNQWLTKQIKENEPEYNYLVTMQNRTYWNVNNPSKTQQCEKLIEFIKNGSPLSSKLR